MISIPPPLEGRIVSRDSGSVTGGLRASKRGVVPSPLALSRSIRA